MVYAIMVAAALLSKAADEKTDLRKAVTLYASFDEEIGADFAGGERTIYRRYNHPKRKGEYVYGKGHDEAAFRIARGKGVAGGGALEAVDVLDNNGRLFFLMTDNIGFKKTGWGGAFSVWINTDPNLRLKTPFCDPVQITQKGANNGGIWFDFNGARPKRDLRMGVFPAVPAGGKAISEDDALAPMVRVPRVGFTSGEWHHVVVSWDHFDSGKANANATLYIDGKRIGSVKDRAIAMDWDVERGGIYVAVNYLGLLDEFAVFGRPLTPDEVALLQREPGVLAALKAK
jgi:hypothetical protein